MAEKSYLSNTKTFQLESFLHFGRPFFAFSANTILIHEIMQLIDIQRFTNNKSKTFFVSSRYVLLCPKTIFWKLGTVMIQASFSVEICQSKNIPFLPSFPSLHLLFLFPCLKKCPNILVIHPFNLLHHFLQAFICVVIGLFAGLRYFGILAW